MNALFSSWYSEVHPEPSDDIIRRRRAGVESLLGTVDKPLALDLARLALALPSREEAVFTRFTAAFQEQDESFRVLDNSNEHAVLAATTIDAAVERGGQIGLFSALASVCVFARGQRTSESAPWLLERVESSLRSWSASLREARQSGPLQLAQVKASVDPKQMQELVAQNKHPEVAEKLANGIIQLSDVCNKWCSGIQESMALLHKRLWLLEEESDMLWWLVAGHSRELGVSFKTLGQHQAALVIGRELADLTRELPGPLAAPALIRHAVNLAKREKTESLQGSVDAVERGWRQSCVDGFNLAACPEFCPLHFAIAKSIESSAWAESYKHHTGLSADNELAAFDLGLQLYRERLLLRLLES